MVADSILHLLERRKRWTFKYRRDGRRHELGLGSARTVPLMKVREIASDLRMALSDGLDPAKLRKKRAAAKARTTFGSFAETWFKGIEGGFKSEKHRAHDPRDLWRAVKQAVQ